MRKPAIITAAFVAVTGLAGCGAAGTDTASIEWGTKYSMTVKDRIDAAAAASDCAALQSEFDTADGNNANTRRRGYDNGTTDLMKYIDGKLREAGCYS